MSASRSLRVLLGACMALAGFAFSAPATAAYSPKLIASGSGPETTLRMRFPAADDATAKATIYVPGPYLLGTPALGATVGSARVVVMRKEPANRKMTLTGKVTATDPTSVSVRALATACTLVPTHEQVWTLTLSGGSSGQESMHVPVFVDRTAGAEAALGGIKLQICFRSPEEPAQAGQPAAGKPTAAELTVQDVLLAPTTPGDYVWRAIFTPYTPGAVSARAAGTVEAQSIARTPAKATLRGRIIVEKRKVRGKLRRRFSVRLTGMVTEAGTQIGGVTVRIVRAGRRVATAKTDESGRFTVTLRLTRTGVFQARAVAPERSTSCQEVSVAPAGCTGATVAGFAARSAALRMRIPKR